MKSYSIKLDLQKLQGAFISNIKGKAATKRCLCIPIGDAGLFEGRQGTYLDLTAVEMREPRYGDTHCIKQYIPGDKFQTMSEEERRKAPILGGLHELTRQEAGQERQPAATAGAEPLSPDEDLPF